MGFLDILAAGYLAKRAYNKFNPPMIEAPDGIKVIGVKARGVGEYRVRFKKDGSNSWSEFNISRSTVSRSGGWKFHWD